MERKQCSTSRLLAFITYNNVHMSERSWICADFPVSVVKFPGSDPIQRITGLTSWKSYRSRKLEGKWGRAFHFFSSSLAQQPNAGQDRLIIEVARPHAMIRHSRQNSSGRVIGPSQRPLSDSTQHSQETDSNAARGIRTRNPCSRKGAHPHLIPQGTAMH
jgi:hypothetical protein